MFCERGKGIEHVGWESVAHPNIKQFSLFYRQCWVTPSAYPTYALFIYFSNIINFDKGIGVPTIYVAILFSLIV